ncbi:hypothetical protein [Rhizorhabdus phycosphaerae]|uniref:hypothetical protein n=1 Tax=Rhizorhabdus phycosphaerae TaxID=2711156 RepID=UPI0013ED0A78|nr:hypothetical protein [Rhizorhabdus phycosphaerae]
MNESWAWTLLGIAPTDDLSTIRRAYARSLKQLDVDADPESYARLRAAREIATHIATTMSDNAEATGTAFDTAGGRGESHGDSLSDEQPQPAPEDPVDPTLLHHRALIDILFPNGEPSDVPLTNEESNQLRSHFSALIEDPRLHDISWYAEASEWFAETLARSLPRSQILFEPAADFFSWAAQDELRRSPAIGFLLSRIEGDAFAGQLKTKQHALHKAWSELTRPAGEKSKRGKVPAEQIRDLLALVRTRYPHLEEQFDWYRVSLWDNPVDHGWQRWRGLVAMIVVIALMQGIKALERNMPADPLPMPSSIYTGAEDPPSLPEAGRDDLSRIVRHVSNGKYGLAELEAKDPKLVERLEKSWFAIRRDGGSADNLLAAASGTIAARYSQNLVHSDIATIDEHLRLMLREAEAVGKKDPGACADILRGRHTDDAAAADLQREKQALLSRVLLQAPAASHEVADPDFARFEIPGDVMADGARDAGMQPSKFAETLERWDAPAPDRCTARKALFRAILAAPNGAPLRRQMMGRDPEDK